MKKENWIWIAGVGVLGAALFFAYKKRSVPKPSIAENPEKESQGDMKKRKLPQSDMLFAGMSGNRIAKTYVKPTNLIPDVYGRYHNADGMGGLDTSSICRACQTSVKHTPQPTMLSNFR